MNRWLAARVRAYTIRRDVERRLGRALYGPELVEGILDEDPTLTCLEVARDDPFLGNAEEGFDEARYFADRGLIVVNRDQPDSTLVTFYKAHEIGHRYVHTRPSSCSADDLDAGQLVLTLPYAEGRIATYHPRQLQESEATVFASELLAPSDRLAAWFDQGENATQIAARFQIPRGLLLSQMATGLLAPSIDFEALLAEGDQAPFHWDQLDESQRPACCAPKGPVLVQAGPGTGKTRTLTSRVEWLITERGVAPERILALTFSNRAADELRLRLRQTIPHAAHHVTVATFHGFGLELLRRYAEFAGVSAEATVLDPVEAERLLEENLERLELDHFADPARPGRFLAEIHGEIARAKEALADSQAYRELADERARRATTEEALDAAAKSQEVARVYRQYEALLQERGLLDYGDLVLKPVQTLLAHPERLAELRRQYDHVLVDEYQDINRANGELVRLLVGEAGEGLWAVGDLRQSIYRFRGASPAYIRRFRQDFPQAEVYDLETNYRAADRLVEFARRVGTRVGVALPEPNWKAGPSEKEGGSIRVALAEDKDAELHGIARSVEAFTERGHHYRDMAVLCRTNGQASEIAAALDRAGVPTVHLGKFLFRREVKGLLAVLALAVEGHGLSWPRVASLMRDPPSSETALALWKAAREGGTPFPAALKLAPDDLELTPLQREDLDRMAAVLTPYAASAAPNPWLVLADFLFEIGHTLRRLRAQGTAASAQALLAIGQTLNLARAFGQRPPVGLETNPSKAFLDHVRRLIERDDSDVDLPVGEVEIDAVSVLTIHKSKGLEFPIVFVPNLAKGRFPTAVGRWKPVPPMEGLEHDPEADGDLLDEERCLFVAITRAKRHLILSRAESYGRRLGKPISRKPSELWRLLDEPLNEMGIEAPTERWSWAAEAQGEAERWVEKPPASLQREGGWLEMRDLLVFQRCPRQYYYRYALGLQVPDDREVYLQFHKAIYQVVDWVQGEAARGPLPAWGAVRDRLEVEYERLMPEGHVHKGWYRREAEVRLHTLWRWMAERQAEPGRARYRVPAEVELQGVSIRFHLDEVIEEAGGALTASRYKMGRRFKSHLEDPTLSLYRQALSRHAGGAMTVRLRYPASDESVEAPGDHDERTLEGLREDVSKLRSGHYPPAPSEGRYWRVCATCSYLFICPIGEITNRD